MYIQLKTKYNLKALAVIIGRHLNKEVIKTMLVVLMVLLMLFVGQRFVMYLGGAAQGRFSSDLVLTLLFLQVPIFISYLLPLSLFLGILISLGKLHTDHEMTVIAACGISDRQIFIYFLPLIIGLSILTGYLTLFQAPTATLIQKQLIADQENKGELSLLTPGRFQQTSDGKKIVYVEGISDDQQLNKVFYVQQDEQKSHAFSLIVSESGRYWSDDDQKHYLVLEKGNQYRGTPGSNQFTTMSFERYFMELKTTSKKAGITKIKAKATSELWNDFTIANQGELQWRIAAPISVALLVLLALPLSRVAPRQGKFARLIPGLLIYIAYMILLITVRNAMNADDLSPLIGTWWIHLLLLGYGYSEFTHWAWLKKLKRQLASKS
ncbi:MAG: LPS export ABC transporter permease LptF [Gammaproteobacteria bacterium]|nr:MAG: LPS export ABC transporter permease LptF [Gammaproteobacteria bacterium]PCJ48427.1 MAG: LPS export ABC transporter permease LptF [Gammaproteobacteria bacterium]